MQIVLLALRLILAAIFLLAGSTKLVDPRGWRQALRDFSVPRFLRGPAMVLLPLLEIAVALSLMPAASAWYGARAAVLLLIAFMLAVAFAMIRGRKPDCHCFGQLHSAPVGWQTLVRNALLGALAAWLALRRPDDLGPGLYDWYNTLGEEASKIAIVAAGAAIFALFVLLVRSRPRPMPVESPVEEETAEDDESVVAAAPQPRPVPRPSVTPPPTTPAPSPPAKVALGIGLPVGTPAPAFELPRLTGEKRSLESLLGQGRDVMLVFTTPGCKACESIPSSLVKWAREMEQTPHIVLITKGKPEDIRAKLKDFGTAQVLMQRQSEVAELYDCISTPSAVLIGADGLIRSELATGGPAIRKLLLTAPSHLPTK